MYLEFLEVKNAYIKASRRAFACGLAAASGGNISARIPGSGYMLTNRVLGADREAFWSFVQSKVEQNR